MNACQNETIINDTDLSEVKKPSPLIMKINCESGIMLENHIETTKIKDDFSNYDIGKKFVDNVNQMLRNPNIKKNVVKSRTPKMMHTTPTLVTRVK